MKKAIITALSAALLLCGCVDKEKRAAEELLDQVKENIENKNYKLAIAQLDTLDHVYKAQVELRREGMQLRPLAIEGAALRDLESTDSLIAVLTIENEKKKESLRFVENPVEGYFVSSKEKAGTFMGSNGIQARISPDGIFYIVSSTTRPVKSTGVTLKAGDKEAKSKNVKYDDERNYRRNGIEVITFMRAECDTLGKFATAHRGEEMSLTFEGEKPYTVKFTTEDAERLAEVYECSQLFMDCQLAQTKKARLEKSLELARNQQARTFSPDSQEDK